MSDQLTSQSRSTESGITRRTALRGAAWSASAVTVVVAAPAYAVTSPGATPKASATDTGSTRDGAKLSLKSQLQAAAGPQAITGLKAVVTVSEGTIASITTPAGWTLSGNPAGGATATFVYIGDLPGAATAAFAPVVTLATNPTASVTSSINFTWTKTGSALLSIPLANAATTTTHVGSKREGKELFPVINFTAGYSLVGLKVKISVSTGSDAIVGQWQAVNGWTKSGDAATLGTIGTYTYDGGTVAKGTSIKLDPKLVLDKNPDANVIATVTVSWTGGSLESFTITLPKKGVAG